MDLRHGPFELAGPGLNMFFYRARRSVKDESLMLLAKDLVAAGASVVLVADLRYGGGRRMRSVGYDGKVCFKGYAIFINYGVKRRLNFV